MAFLHHAPGHDPRVTARPLSSLLSTSPLVQSSAAAIPNIVQPSSRNFSTRSKPTSPGDLDVHLVMDNYATHKTKPIRDWLANRPRWHVHFTPTGASWINQVERFFALITEKQIRRGVHRSTRQLEADIRAFTDAHNADPKPFVGQHPPTIFSRRSSASALEQCRSAGFQKRDTRIEAYHRRQLTLTRKLNASALLTLASARSGSSVLAHARALQPSHCVQCCLPRPDLSR